MSDAPVHPVDSHGNQAAQPSAPSAADATRAVSGTLHIPLAAHALGDELFLHVAIKDACARGVGAP